MGAFELYLVSIGYSVHYSDGRLFDKDYSLYYYSTMKELFYLFKKDGCKDICFGLSDVGCPPYLIYPYINGYSCGKDLVNLQTTHTPKEIYLMIEP